MRVSEEIEMEDVGRSLPSLDLVEEFSCRVISRYQKKMALYLLEIAGMDGLSRFRTERSLPFGVIKHFRRVMDLFDESTQYLLGQLRHRGIIVQCKPDCSYCCFNMPYGLSTLELIWVYHGSSLTGKSSRLFRRLLEVEELWEELRRRRSGKEDHDTSHPSAWEREELLKSYQKLCQPCPFLQESSCLVYRYRPIACRMHFSLSPSYWCNPRHFQHDHAVRFNLEPGDCVQDAFEQIDERFGLNISHTMICGLLELTVNIMQFEPIRWT